MLLIVGANGVLSFDLRLGGGWDEGKARMSLVEISTGSETNLSMTMLLIRSGLTTLSGDLLAISIWLIRGEGCADERGMSEW